jgi:hypothetical protein
MCTRADQQGLSVYGVTMLNRLAYKDRRDLCKKTIDAMLSLRGGYDYGLHPSRAWHPRNHQPHLAKFDQQDDPCCSGQKRSSSISSGCETKGFERVLAYLHVGERIGLLPFSPPYRPRPKLRR